MPLLGRKTRAEILAATVHAARPSDPESRAEQRCAVCGWSVKLIGAGKWVHVATGAVAAPNPPD